MSSKGQVLGNIRQTVDENGGIISAQDYSPYGEIIRSYNNADANDKYKFTEKERDKETNLDYFGARYYDASIGRWLNIDPLADIYPGITPYNYVNNNPLNLIDPKGLSAEPAQAVDEEEEAEDRKIKTLSNRLARVDEEQTRAEYGLSPRNDEGEKKKKKTENRSDFTGSYDKTTMQLNDKETDNFFNTFSQNITDKGAITGRIMTVLGFFTPGFLKLVVPLLGLGFSERYAYLSTEMGNARSIYDNKGKHQGCTIVQEISYLNDGVTKRTTIILNIKFYINSKFEYQIIF